MSAIADVVIVIEPGNHEFPVQPMVANYINQLQRDNARLKQNAARYRYLRNDDGRAYHGNPDLYPYAVRGACGKTEPLFGDELDHAVDEAISTPMGWDGEPVAVARERVDP